METTVRRAPVLVTALAIAAILTALLPGTTAAARTGKLGFRQVAVGHQPTSLSSPPGFPKLIFVTERTGRVRALRSGKWLPGNLLDLSKQVRSRVIEQGLLGMAIPGDFRKTGRFYLNYTGKSGDSLVVEYRTVPGHPDQLVRHSRRLVMRIPKVANGGNHNGGRMVFFGGRLYIGVGDGFDPGDPGNNAQNLMSLRGKILRIDPRPDPQGHRAYRIPADNPFVGIPGRDEIFAYGLRNPFSFSFFDSGGESMMSIADVGQLRYEELNVLPFDQARGANFGWKGYEGFEPYNCGEELCPNGADPLVTTGLKWPQLVYSHEDGCAIVGALKVTSPGLPSIRERIIYGDFCRGRIRTAAPHQPTITDDRSVGFSLPKKHGLVLLNGFGVDGAGHLFAFSHHGGIYRIVQK